MGRVYRRNGHWYLDYKDRNGRRVRQMVPDAEARTQREAKGLLADLEADELRVAREIRRGVYDARTNHVEIGPLLEAYLLHTAATKRYETARAWRSALLLPGARARIALTRMLRLCISGGTRDMGSAR